MRTKNINSAFSTAQSISHDSVTPFLPQSPVLQHPYLPLRMAGVCPVNPYVQVLMVVDPVSVSIIDMDIAHACCRKAESPDSERNVISCERNGVVQWLNFYNRGFPTITMFAFLCFFIYKIMS